MIEKQELQKLQTHFELWYNCIKDDQAKSVDKYMSTNIKKTLNDKREVNDLFSRLTELKDQFVEFQEEISDSLDGWNMVIDEKKEQLLDAEDQVTDSKSRVSQIDAEIIQLQNLKGETVEKYTPIMEKQLVSLSQLADPIMKEILELCNLLMFDNKTFNFEKFMQIGFGKQIPQPHAAQPAPQAPQQSQPPQKEEKKGLLAQLTAKLDKTADETKTPQKQEIQKQEDKGKEPEDDQQPLQFEEDENASPMKQNNEDKSGQKPGMGNQEPKESGKQEEKKSLFRQKLNHLKPEEVLRRAEPLLKFFTEEKSSEIKKSQTYQNNVFGCQTIYEWLDIIKQQVELLQERAQAMPRLKEAQRVQEQVKRELDIEFDNNMIKLQTAALEEQEKLRKYAEELTTALEELDATYEDVMKYFLDEKKQMQLTLTAGQDLCEINQQFYLK